MRNETLQDGLLEKNQFRALMSLHHPVADYFPITAYFDKFIIQH